MHGLEGNWTPYGGMQIAEDYQAFNLGIGKDFRTFWCLFFRYHAGQYDTCRWHPSRAIG
ncbi:fimbria/pilus outer membrane usher protein [Escherichia coli]